LPLTPNPFKYLIYTTLLIKLFVNALMASLCQQFKSNIVMIAINALNDLAAKITAYVSLCINFCKLLCMQKQALNFVRNPLISVL